MIQILACFIYNEPRGAAAGHEFSAAAGFTYNFKNRIRNIRTASTSLAGITKGWISMISETPSVSQLSEVISQAAAPAFLLGALAAFIAVLTSRLNRIVDRTVIPNGIPDDDTVRRRLKADLPRLMRRAAMMNRAIFWAVIGSIAVTVLVVVAFASAFFQVQHERGVAILFIVALGAFTISLVDFAREVRIALSEFDHHG
jgi:hypothetical protein